MINNINIEEKIKEMTQEELIELLKSNNLSLIFKIVNEYPHIITNISNIKIIELFGEKETFNQTYFIKKYINKFNSFSVIELIEYLDRCKDYQVYNFYINFNYLFNKLKDTKEFEVFRLISHFEEIKIHNQDVFKKLNIKEYVNKTKLICENNEEKHIDRLENSYMNLVSIYPILNKYSEERKFAIEIISKYIHEERYLSESMIKYITKDILVKHNLFKYCQNVYVNSLQKNVIGEYKHNFGFNNNISDKIMIDKDKHQYFNQHNYNNYLYEIVHTICHEINHLKQNDILSYSIYENQVINQHNYKYYNVLNKDLIFSTLFFEHYKSNHDEYLSEYNSNIIGHIDALRYFQDNFSKILEDDFFKENYHKLIVFIDNSYTRKLTLLKSVKTTPIEKFEILFNNKNIKSKRSNEYDQIYLNEEDIPIGFISEYDKLVLGDKNKIVDVIRKHKLHSSNHKMGLEIVDKIINVDNDYFDDELESIVKKYTRKSD